MSLLRTAAAALLLAAAPALAQEEAITDEAATEQAVDEVDHAPDEVAEAEWNGFTVSPFRRDPKSELRFQKGGKIVHREREPAAMTWSVARPQDLDGDGRRELHAWFWSGGAHCCITHIVFPATMAKAKSPGAAWRLEQGDGDPQAFRTIPGRDRPVMAVLDSSTAYLSGSFAGTPFLPYFVEVGPDGLRLAQGMMRSDAPGAGPAVLRGTDAALAAFVRGDGESRSRTLAGLEPPAARLAKIRSAVDAAVAQGSAEGKPFDRLKASGGLSHIERHIRIYCLYDEAPCDVRALAREAEGPHTGLLAAWAKELEKRWLGSQVRRLKLRTAKR
jgi:hypothetical protein